MKIQIISLKPTPEFWLFTSNIPARPLGVGGPACAASLVNLWLQKPVLGFVTYFKQIF